jgi:hypothetical protein
MIPSRRFVSSRLAHHLDGALRKSLLRALARDLSLPQDHFAVTATMQALASVALKRQTLVVEGEPVDHVPEQLADVSLDTWCCVAACAAARTDAA